MVNKMNDWETIEKIVNTLPQWDIIKLIIGIQEENQELKQKYENAVADYETTMFEKVKLERQQKEFIDYMNKTIEELECDDVDDEEIKGYLIQRIDTFKQILQKYKSIIGVSDDKK